MAEATTDTRRIVKKRPFYPSTLKPMPAESAEHSRRRKGWFPQHKEIWRRTEEFRRAMAYLSKPTYKEQALWASCILLVLTLASWFLWPDTISAAMRTGYAKANGARIPSVSSIGIVLLTLQNSAALYGIFRFIERKRRNEAMLVRDRYQEWLAKPEVTQDDLQTVLLPTYKEDNPYDPTDPDINLVLGEYYDNAAHKFGPTAEWYNMKMKGLQAGGCIIFGITGSGKTSSMLKPLMRQIISWMAHVDYDPADKGREKVAGFVVDPKGSLAVDVQSVMKTAGIDPIRDPLQLKGKGPAYLTNLYYLMHRRKGARNGKKQLLFDPEIVKGYRGRSDDYLELGYDELKVDEVWRRFEAFSSACGHLVGQEYSPHSVDSRSNMPKILRGGQLSMTVPLEVKREEGARDDHTAPYDLKAFLAGKGTIPRRDLANMNVVIESIIWDKGLDPGMSGPLEPLGKALDDFLRWIWVGRKIGSQVGTGDRPLEVHPMVPGLPFSTRFALDAYAVNRNQIRRYAPAKQRPTSGVDEYRDSWGWREVRLWEFKEHQVQVANRVEAAAQMFALVKRFPAKNVLIEEREKAEAYGTQIAGVTRLLRTPLKDLLGEESVAWEHGRKKVAATAPLLKAIDQIRVTLDAKMSKAFKDGDFQLLTVPTSERPKPLPVDEQTEKKLGGRHAAPDPLVELAFRVVELRKTEGKLVDDLLREAADGIREAEAEVQRTIADWSLHISDRISLLGKEPSAPVNQFLIGAMDAIRAGNGDVRDLADDLVATLLGMPTVATKETEVLLNAFLLRAKGGKGAQFGLQAAHGALSPHATELWRFVQRSTDAVASEWTKKHLDGVLVAAQSYLAASGLIDVERDRILTEIRSAVRAMADGWIHAHLSALEWVLESEGWRARLSEIGASGHAIFREADRLARMGAMVGCVEDSLVTDPRDRIPASPNVDWGSLIWCWQMSNGGARRGPFWRGPMQALDMTPLHAMQWDPSWSSLAWRLLSYSLNSAPSGVDQLQQLAKRGTVLGVYHQAALESFVATVAPNIGWRTFGPYAYNPLYAPDLAPIVVAGTFNQTVFAATSDGKDSGDPFWENASFTVVFNLLQTLQLVDGYASFPKIDALVTNEATLRDYVSILRERSAKRDGSPEEIEVITNILRWVDGEWLTEASSKSETKDNIVRSLSVVTQPFKEPRFAVCFAPACKEDISFPSWTWLMREGKICAANLPWEKYEKVAKVVLPLANKTFQKGVQMRDGQRGINEQIQARNRPEIKELWAQADELSKSIARRACERFVLMMFFKRDMALKGDGKKYHPKGDHILGKWRELLDAKGGMLRSRPCMGDIFMRPAQIGSVTMDAIAGFVLAAKGVETPMAGAYLLAPRAVQAGIEAGFFARMLADASSQARVTLDEIANGGDAGAQRLLDAFGKLTKTRVEDEVRKNLELLGFADPSEVVTAAKGLPGILLDHMDEILGREGVMKWTSHMEQLIHDERGGASDSADEGAGSAMRPRFKLWAIYKEIKRLEAQIAEMPNTSRPVLYLVDEAQFFVSKTDAQYVSVARSNNALNFYSTQSPNAFFAKMEESDAKQFLDNLPNRIILRMPDAKAAETCAEFLGGKVRRSVVEKNVSQNFGDMRHDSMRGGGQGKGEGGSVSVNIKEEERWIVELTQIVNLQAFECFAMVWDGKKNLPPRRVYSKPDYLYVVPTIRNYKRIKGDRFGDLPADYKDELDLFELPVPRLLELGVIDASR